MGNCCGRESDNFQGEGRTLGASPANAPPQTDGARAAAPPKTKISSPKGGKTLGKNPQAPDQSESPREAAARAAQARADASNKPGGELSKKLKEQQQSTQGQLLNQGAEENRAAREADAAAQARNYD